MTDTPPRQVVSQRSLIGKETGITLGLVVMILFGGGGGFFLWAKADTAWKVNRERDIDEIKKDSAREFNDLRNEQLRQFAEIKIKLDEIEQNGIDDRLRFSTFRLWCEQYGRMNPSSTMPDLDSIRNRRD